MTLKKIRGGIRTNTAGSSLVSTCDNFADMLSLFRTAYADHGDDHFLILALKAQYEDGQLISKTKVGDPDPIREFGVGKYKLGGEAHGEVTLANGAGWLFRSLGRIGPNADAARKTFSRLGGCAGGLLPLSRAKQLGAMDQPDPLSMWIFVLLSSRCSRIGSTGEHRAILEPFAASINALKQQLESQNDSQAEAQRTVHDVKTRFTTLDRIAAEARRWRDALQQLNLLTRPNSLPNERSQIAQAELERATKSLQILMASQSIEEDRWPVDVGTVLGQLRDGVRAIGPNANYRGLASIAGTAVNVLRNHLKTQVSIGGDTTAARRRA